jgi:hypothetical protein
MVEWLAILIFLISQYKEISLVQLGIVRRSVEASSQNAHTALQICHVHIVRGPDCWENAENKHLSSFEDWK